MNIENSNMHYLLSIVYPLLAIPYWLFPIGSSLSPICLASGARQPVPSGALMLPGLAGAALLLGQRDRHWAICTSIYKCK